MGVNKVLTESELKKLNKQFAVLRDLSIEIGNAALQKEQIIRNANANFESKYAEYQQKSSEEQKYLKKLTEELSEKYGPSQYKLDTGEIIPMPDPKAPAPKEEVKK